MWNTESTSQSKTPNRNAQKSTLNSDNPHFTTEHYLYNEDGVIFFSYVAKSRIIQINGLLKIFSHNKQEIKELLLLNRTEKEALQLANEILSSK